MILNYFEWVWIILNYFELFPKPSQKKPLGGFPLFYGDHKAWFADAKFAQGTFSKSFDVSSLGDWKLKLQEVHAWLWQKWFVVKTEKKFVWNQRKNRKQDSSKIRISCLPWSILKAIRCLARPSIPGQGRKNDGSPKGFGMEDSIFAVGGIFFWMLWYFSAVKRMLWNVCICFGMLQHFSDLLMNYPLMSYPNLSNDSTMPKTITPATFFSLPLWMFPQGRGQNTRFGRTYYSIFMHTVIYTANFS